MPDEKQDKPPPAQPTGAETAALTRKQVADLLGVSVFKVRTLERKGELHPVVRDGTNFFTRAEVNALLQTASPERRRGSRPIDPRTDGEIAAEVFKLFDEGKALSEIVRIAAVVPERVRALYEEYEVSLDEGSRRARQRERKLEQERAAEAEKALSDEHEKRMRVIDREIAAQRRQADRIAKMNERARDRQARVFPLSSPPVPPQASETPPAASRSWEEIFPDPAKKSR